MSNINIKRIYTYVKMNQYTVNKRILFRNINKYTIGLMIIILYIIYLNKYDDMCDCNIIV